ncbi:MAG: hypothetical protein HOE30_23285 [Deltaproteobacteria bacterium]|nr:hypothetical protein [Deltaproteobacteria bacterium]MBT4264779.1 hypothetical protein [Deltaproteobacteria bacterium]
MSKEKIKQFFIGKTIKDIEISTDYGDYCVDSITFEDGVILRLFGRSDECRICNSPTLPDEINDEIKKLKAVYNER